MASDGTPLQLHQHQAERPPEDSAENVGMDQHVPRWVNAGMDRQRLVHAANADTDRLRLRLRLQLQLVRVVNVGTDQLLVARLLVVHMRLAAHRAAASRHSQPLLEHRKQQ